MRRILQLSMLCLAAGVTSACKPDEIIETEIIPTAGVRFINAVPDTGAMDFRFVDMVESNAHWNIPFRNNVVTSASVPASTLVQYKNARAGQRHFRIFMSGTTAAVATTVVKDTTVTLEAGKLYTALLWGNARGGATPLKLTFFEDGNVPAPFDTTTQVALRVINAAATLPPPNTTNNIDVRQYPSTGTAPATATWANVAPLSISSYLVRTPDTIRYNVRAAGGAAALFTDPRALVGDSARLGPPGPFDEVPGTTRPGSAVTAIVFPGSVPGSQAPQTSAFLFTTGSIPISVTPTSYVRTTGSFVTEGFAIGMQVTASGFSFPANNGVATVTGVSATTLTVSKTPALVVEAGTTGSTTLAATATGYSRTAGSFIAQGFAVGMTISATGFANAVNNGPSVVTAVTATDLTVTKSPATVVEAAAAGRTITNTSTRTIAAPKLAISFVWDRRPPRPKGI